MINRVALVGLGRSNTGAEMKEKRKFRLLRYLNRPATLLGTPATSQMVLIRVLRPSKSVAWHKDEEYNDSNTDEDGDEQDHHGALIQKPSNVWFADARPVHKGVLAKASKSEDGVDGVLVR